MGILDFLFGNRNTEQNTTQTVSQDTNVQSEQVRNTATGRSQATGTVGAQTGTQSNTQTSIIEALRPEDLAILQQVFQAAAGNFTGGGDPNVNNALGSQQIITDIANNRAATSGADIQSQIAAIVAGARQRGQDSTNLANRQFGERAGSSLNTVVQDLSQRNQNDLETQLAALEGQLGLQGRETISRDILTAITGAQAGVEGATRASAVGSEQVAQLANILRGAVTTQTGAGDVVTSQQNEQQSVTNELSQIIDILSQLSSQRTTGVTSGNTNQTQNSTIFDLISSLSAFR